MRLGVVVACLVAATAFAVVVATTTVVSVIEADERAQAGGISTVSCEASIGPTGQGDRRRAEVQVGNLDEEQRGIVALIVSIGKQRELSPRAWQIAIQAGMTESGLRNLRHGDRDSLGIFQMRPSMGWGTIAQVTHPTYQVNKFYDVLESLPDWQSRRPGDAAQAVERSAFPDRYHQWESMAVHLVENVGKVGDAAGCGESAGSALPPSEAAAQAIKFAMKERGKPYVWGATGPDSYDCSGLLLRAFESAGITLPRVSRDQYRAGAMLPVEKAKPGDLLFWAYDRSNPATIHHVAMYIGDGQIVEAQQSGVPVHTRSVVFDEAELLPVAVRPGV
ncbi:MAG: NlpC/P60 family protein [Actinophytocola sp.]|nr:NlpC/P60 family protein [Actinophytocola sp.]